MNVCTTEVLMFESIGAGSTPLSESRITGKRLIRPLSHQRPYDKIICAPICGDSLKDDDILPGDFAILRLNFELHELRPDQLVVVECPSGVVMKYISLTDDGRVRLSSRNSTYPDLEFDLDDVTFQAIVMRTERVIHDWEI